MALMTEAASCVSCLLEHRANRALYDGTRTRKASFKVLAQQNARVKLLEMHMEHKDTETPQLVKSVACFDQSGATKWSL